MFCIGLHWFLWKYIYFWAFRCAKLGLPKRLKEPIIWKAHLRALHFFSAVRRTTPRRACIQFTINFRLYSLKIMDSFSTFWVEKFRAGGPSSLEPQAQGPICRAEPHACSVLAPASNSWSTSSSQQRKKVEQMQVKSYEIWCLSGPNLEGRASCIKCMGPSFQFMEHQQPPAVKIVEQI